MILRLLVASLVVSIVLAASDAGAASCPNVAGDAFTFLAPETVCLTKPLARWTDARAVYDCRFFADAATAIDCKADAASCVNLCDTAANVWNTDLQGRFTFVPATDPVSFCNLEDGISSIGGTTKQCDGSAYGPNVLAITVSFYNGSTGALSDANITVNQAFNFYFDQLSFQATIAHELGHVLGLSHPNKPACGKDSNVLMRTAELFRSTDPCFVLEPTVADLNGAEQIYPVLNATPTPTATPGICGDADLSGAVTVSDGVHVLRAAAGLSTDCTLALCDVDGSGSITVTDGVNVLRGAAGLSFPAACPH